MVVPFSWVTMTRRGDDNVVEDSPFIISEGLQLVPVKLVKNILYLGAILSTRRSCYVIIWRQTGGCKGVKQGALMAVPRDSGAGGRCLTC